MKPITLGQLLHFPADSARQIAERHGSAMSHGEFLQRLSRLTVALEADPACRWLLYIEDSVEFALALFALLCAGKQVMIAPNRQPGLIQQLVTLCDAALCDAVGSDGNLVHKTRCLDEWLASVPVASSLESSKKIDEALTLTIITSGSTGEPKQIVKSLRSFVAEVAALESLWGDTMEGVTVFATVSHHHIYGLLFRILWPIAHGRVLRADTHAYPEPLFSDIARTDKAILVSSPAHLKRIPEAIDGASIHSSLAMVFSSGGPLAEHYALDFKRRFGKTPIEVFGSTETGGVAFRQQDGTKMGQIWNVMPDVSIRLDEATQCLAIQSPFCCEQDWFLMGDRIEWIDAQHYIHRGRADRVVKIEEKRVSLTAMEEQLKRHEQVCDARILLLADATHRQQLGAVVVLPEDKALPDEENRLALSRDLREHLLPFFERSLLPRKWRYVNALPVNHQGKITETDLQALFLPANFPYDSITSQMKILEQTSMKLHACLDTRLHSWIFDGHFDQMPILPAVMQIDWVIRLVQQRWYPQAPFAGVSRIKFQCPIQPGDVLDILLTHDGKGKVQCIYSCAGQEMSSGIFSFGV